MYTTLTTAPYFNWEQCLNWNKWYCIAFFCWIHDIITIIPYTLYFEPKFHTPFSVSTNHQQFTHTHTHLTSICWNRYVVGINACHFNNRMLRIKDLQLNKKKTEHVYFFFFIQWIAHKFINEGASMKNDNINNKKKKKIGMIWKLISINL